MLTYERFNKKYGVYKLNHIVNPVPINISGFEFPRDSELHEFKVTDINEALKREGYFTNVKQVYVNTPLLYVEPIYGHVTRLSKTDMSVINDLTKAEKTFRFLRPNMHLATVNTNALIVYNYGSINNMYRYSSNPYNRYYQWQNSFQTLIDHLRKPSDRMKFVRISLPATLPTRVELDMASKKITVGMLNDLYTTYEYFTLIELWKFFNPDHKQDSLLNTIPKEEYRNITLMINIDNKIVPFNLNTLIGMIKEYEVDDIIKPVRADSFRKLFYYYLYRIINTPSNEASIINNEMSTAPEINLPMSGITGNNNSILDIDRLFETEVHEIPLSTKNSLSVIKQDDIGEMEPDVIEEEAKTSFEISTTLMGHVDNYTDMDSLKHEIISPTTKLAEELNTLVGYGMISKNDYAKLTEVVSEQKNKAAPYNPKLKLSEVLNSDTDDYTIQPKDIEISPNNVVFDAKQNKDTTGVLDKQYLAKQYHKDLTRTIYSMQNAGIVVEDYTVTKNESILGSMEEHVITLRPLNGKASTVKLILPEISPDGSFKISSNHYRIRKQRADLPIRKIDSTIVSLSSYYGKLFITKAYAKKDDAGYWFKNQLAKLYETNESLRDIVFLPVDNQDVKLPVLYTNISRYIRSFKYKTIYFSFDYKNRLKLIKDLDSETLADIEDNDVVLVGVKINTPIVMNMSGKLFEYKNNAYTEIDDVYTMLELDTSKMPTEYTVVKIYKQTIPTVILLSYYLGLKNLLGLLKVGYREYDIKAKINPAELTFKEWYVITFSDVKYVIEKDNDIGDLIIFGLNSIKDILKTNPSTLFNSKEGMGIIFSKMNLSILYTNEIKLLETMFVDPVTLTILKEMKEPLTFKGLLIRANELLVDNNYTHPNNITEMTIKGYERVSGMIYKEMVTALKEHNNRSLFSKSKITINPYRILTKINEDSTTVLVDDLNPIAMLKQTEDITYLGENGRGKEGMSRDTRIMHSSEIGVISEASKDSGDVGISAYMSANPTITNVRGNIGDFDFDKQGWSSVLSTSAMIAPFAKNDDVKRLNFSSIQGSHVIPIKNMRAPYVRTGYETILPVRVGGKFISTAEEEGVVTKVTSKYVEVLYKTLGTKRYTLRSWTTKEESNTCYTHTMVTSLTIGDTVIKDDTVIYADTFFEPDIFNPKRVLYKQGDIATIALSEDPETYEDSGSISEDIYARLATTVTKVKSIVVNNTDNIINLIGVNSKVEPNTVLFSILDKSLGDTKNLDDRAREILQNLKTTSPKAKLKGTVSKIVIFYNCEFDTLSESLKELVTISDAKLKEETGFTGRVTNSYSINGISLSADSVEIKLYLHAEDMMSIGDKAIFGNQLKFTVGSVYKNKVSATDGTIVEGFFSNKSIQARIVNSPMLIGTTSMLLDKITDKVIDMYFN